MSSLCLRPLDLKLIGWPEEAGTGGNVPDGLGCSDGNLSTPLKTLTTVALNGTGVFDVLMRASKIHLQEEYDAGRLIGKEYSSVYLGTIQSVLSSSIQFLVNEQQVHKIAAEVGLIRQKTVTELTETDDSIPVGLGFNHYDDSDSSITPISCTNIPESCG